MNSLAFRRAKSSDIDELVSFGRAAFTRTFGHLYPPSHLESYLNEEYTNKIFEAWLNEPNYSIFVAVDANNKIFGYSIACPCVLPVKELTSADGELMRLYLDPSVFGNGTAQTLMTMALDWLQEKFENIYLSVYSDNIRAQKFYAKFGFQKSDEFLFKVGDSYDKEYLMKLIKP